MGTQCICRTCSNCLILELCCNNVDVEDCPVPYLDCVTGDCFLDECFSDKFDRILNIGNGCATLNIDDDNIIYYSILKPWPYGKTKKCKTQYHSIGHYLKQSTLQLEDYLYHRYTKAGQSIRDMYSLIKLIIK